MIVVKPNKIGIKKAIAILKNGGVVVYPTDTAYALGGIFDWPAVTQKILKIKKRKDKKFTLVAASLVQVEKFFKFNNLEKKLAEKYWPGPLSIAVLPRFAVRVPKNQITRFLAQKVGGPLIATSANISGQPALYDSGRIIKQFLKEKNPRLRQPALRRRLRQGEGFGGQEPDLILDCGRLPRKPVSTIVKIKNGKKIEVIRQGAVKIKFEF
ncbi:MAG: hypothetical protein A2729_03330 [Candidatus Buchananbacteria bacterium RIFCSPHIGHO2_01_FULL_39_14]|uniref:L-threonylcarbamoyladenylate synthase n=2 Tax=Candidatus Buchananiibacteriota TaxID=1817903 RepID=A0A1G1YVZ4_9BACT|nr:MAG: hypothetical protein A2729_03330 [Candidatus Buchananbacteria bacterium RIFCSPHIGHO2_01_FULL_39_14]OGY48341.1 MAG: hypothetical protein A3D39_02290 [Candidatus Buchananbacteria bacterium RIFCSPHIGHO2_02_FULL_39_17]OGY55936.1 MAG: hypothetical protein A2912_03040 [Candidatus Buchananbacteria bacterium RIFCSPLOWO2_01_FULL_40_23b]